MYSVNYRTNFKVCTNKFARFQNTLMQVYMITQFMHFRNAPHQLSKKGAP